MDISIDLYQLLSPPAIVKYLKQPKGIESRLYTAQTPIPHSPSCDSSFQKKRDILGELMIPLRIEYFFDETKGFYYGLMFNPANLNDEIPPFAVQVYFVNASNQPTQIHKLIYPKKGETLVLHYKNSNDNFSSDGIINWAKSLKVECVESDDGGNKKEFDEVFKHFRKMKERRKDEGRVLSS